MRFIRMIRLGARSADSVAIVEVRYSGTPDGPLYVQSTEQVIAFIDSGLQAYRTHHHRTGEQAAVATRSTSAGVRYLVSVVDGEPSPHLMELPRYVVARRGP